jgi:hypothetical protein
MATSCVTNRAVGVRWCHAASSVVTEHTSSAAGIWSPTPCPCNEKLREIRVALGARVDLLC